MGNQLSQMFPPAPTFTEDSLPDLKDKVFIVTGASAGIGKELARLLYSRNGTVYAAARSTKKTTAALAWIKEQHPSSKGKLTHLHLDLNDLEGIKPSVENFLAQESRLDVLINNAGVFMTPLGPKTKQGYEIQLGTNCIAPFLFTKLLTPLLVATAKKEPAGSVRVAWVSSSAADVSAPKGGVDMQNLGYNKNTSTTAKYAVSKGGNILHAIEFRRRYGGEGVVSIPLNPGNLKTDLANHIPIWQRLIVKLITHPVINGAYTELFASLAPEAAKLKESEWVVPWGRIMPLRQDFYSEEGKENGKAFWEWCEQQVERYT
ncbi:hypothetical protein COCCADRAFT_33506 [Bipolaris zeicola 26-R-13]|uniref:NAD(P)-binding protein n=1 Tax=Cochliobolus carbonum (strain 26-R-13) TaxID=930089 RepID=W6YHT7_COCC2|nr:uncharacterized protein COCCADRAFT_33506 [Bipolaris zeicola 26-R-13]EUC37238.1 hypothetical protein COCCADRAFT_33506 [Bipolaris zeicola 26-R-13]